MKIEKHLKKKEALKRMKLLKLLPNVIEEFEKEDVVYYSEKGGILFWLHNHPEWLEYVKKLEEKHNFLAYHAELSHLEFGRHLSIFYVSDHKEEWARDREELKEGYSCCYVWDMDGSFSEMGVIGFKPMTGGVKRTE